MKKRIFVGSSQKSLSKAKEIAQLLERLDADVKLWTCEELFVPSVSFLDAVTGAVDFFNGAVFVFGQDDKKRKKGEDGKYYLPRDNVLFEAGLFMDRLGRHAVAVCVEEDVQVLSDLAGIKTVRFCDDRDKMRRQLDAWLNHMVDDLPIGARENLYMDSRSAIHRLYPLTDRFHMRADVYRHISHIRLMNLAGNLFINPEVADSGRPASGEPDPSELLKRIMQDSPATVEIILADPSSANIKDARLKIHNRNVGGLPEGSIYSAWATLYRTALLEGGVYYPYCHGTPRRFHLYALKVGMPYAIFNVEFDDEYRRFNHVKIDLYSLCFGAEDERRSFVVWEQRDPDNYQYFKHAFESIKEKGRNYIREPKPKTVEKWLDDWNSRQK